MKTGICSKRSQLLTFLRAGLGLGLLTIAALAIAVALPTGAEAVNTCNGSFQVNYISPPTPNFPDCR